MSEPITGDSKQGIPKLTMKQPYARTRFLSKQARAGIDLVRPFTLAAPFLVSMAIATASLIYNRDQIPITYMQNSKRILNPSLTVLDIGELEF